MMPRQHCPVCGNRPRASLDIAKSQIIERQMAHLKELRAICRRAAACMYAGKFESETYRRLKEAGWDEEGKER